LQHLKGTYKPFRITIKNLQNVLPKLYTVKKKRHKKDFLRTNYYTTEKTKVEFLKGLSHEN